MGIISNADMSAAEFNNYRAESDGEVYEFHAVSVRQAWYLAFEHFNHESLDYLAEINRLGNPITVILDKED